MMTPKQTATNGEHWIGNQLYVWCGNTAVPIRKRDAAGDIVKPPEQETENNDNQRPLTAKGTNDEPI